MVCYMTIYLGERKFLFSDGMETEKQVTEEESSDSDGSYEDSGSEEDSRLSGGEADSRRERETGGTGCRA